MPSSLSPPPLDGYRPHILAINNDPAVLALFRDLLEEAGYQVSTQNYVDRDLAQPAWADWVADPGDQNSAAWRRGRQEIIMKPPLNRRGLQGTRAVGMALLATSPVVVRMGRRGNGQPGDGKPGNG